MRTNERKHALIKDCNAFKTIATILKNYIYSTCMQHITMLNKYINGIFCYILILFFNVLFVKDLEMEVDSLASHNSNLNRFSDLELV